MVAWECPGREPEEPLEVVRNDHAPCEQVDLGEDRRSYFEGATDAAAIHGDRLAGVALPAQALRRDTNLTTKLWSCRRAVVISSGSLAAFGCLRQPLNGPSLIFGCQVTVSYDTLGQLFVVLWRS